MNIPENQHVIPAGQQKVLDFTERNWNHACSLIIDPGAGGTVHVYYSNSPLAVTTPADPSVIWFEDTGGAVVAVKEIVRFAPCKAIKITATAAIANVHQKG